MSQGIGTCMSQGIDKVDLFEFLLRIIKLV